MTSSTAPPPGLRNALAMARLALSDPCVDEVTKCLAGYLVSTLSPGEVLPDPEVYTGAVIITYDMVGQWKPQQINAMARLLLLAAEKAQEL